MSALSPIDGRYKNQTSSLRTHFSEAALISFRIKIELTYLRFLASYQVISPLTADEVSALHVLAEPTDGAITRVKELEAKTHHDVKAVEYYLREQLEERKLTRLIPFIHFAITSEDVNNIAYRLMLRGGVHEVVLPSLLQMLVNLQQLIKQHAAVPMLARTHGQPAIPTTFGKEMAVFTQRALPLIQEIKAFRLHGKFSGAVGGYQAMQLASPITEWRRLSQELLAEFDLQQAAVTTQICPNDDIVALLSSFMRLNGILLDLNQDIWRYISDGWLKQKDKEQFVGSSTMPQKINPIEFENSEGNLVMANAMIEGMLRKLPISRLQRDLSESTILRNLGVVMGHCLLAYQSLSGGLAKLAVDEGVMQQALSANYAILTEAWQTVARLRGDETAYETAAAAAKNKVLTQADWQAATQAIDSHLAALQPSDYLGLSEQLAQETVSRVDDFLATSGLPTTKYS